MGEAPPDWPGVGPIDLAVHDLPHASAHTEWWYLHCHLETEAGTELGLFAAFFRIVSGRDAATGQPSYAHSVSWAVSDIAAKRYTSFAGVDRQAPAMGLARIRSGRGAKDALLNRAMAEVFEQGVVPAPDRLLASAAAVGGDRLALDFGGMRLDKDDSGAYRLRLHDPLSGAACDLSFTPSKPVVRQGDEGVVAGANPGETYFYYSITRCAVDGTVTVGAAPSRVGSGQGWFDHQFGGRPGARPADEEGSGPGQTPAETRAAKPHHETGEVPRGLDDAVLTRDVAWTWLGAHLSDGVDVCAYVAVDRVSGEVVEERLMIVDADGRCRSTAAFSLSVHRTWRSARTFQAYPTGFRLRSECVGLDVEIEADIDDQEIITLISYPSFWEGRCGLRGRHGERSVSGHGYVERHGYGDIEDLDQLCTEVGTEVRLSIDRVLPRRPDYVQARSLIASADHDHYMAGVDIDRLADDLIAPIRDVVDRGGKSWRSYVALACCDAVGGDSRRFVQWLGAPELMHAGSMIVDDVQDRARLRRGGAAAHLVHGEARAINAGTAAYFIAQRILRDNDLSVEQNQRIYDLYFLAMRAGHAGQAIDLGGMDDLVPEALATGDSAALERRILASYRLKTAAPAASLAAVGAIAGDGSEAQIGAVAAFVEAMALGFQITDDLLDLRGFRGELKTRGQDIRNGHVTFPIARGLGLLERPEREWLWATLRSKPTRKRTVTEIVTLLESCGALASCSAYARELVEDAWRNAAPLLEPSYSTVMLRSLGWFALERRH